MNFMQAVQVCLSKYVDFKGRAQRPEFWWFFLFQVIVAIVASFLGDVISSIAGLALLLPAIAVGARRLHDVGKSGWLQLIALIPLIGFIVLIYFWVQPGSTEPNVHGEIVV
ncbi:MULTISPECIES: DUF805 domain-containing protein [unclassified Variovorax]|uniref:DUF805 domain-containing protein n=1 Tax=unclassified Variovorax TaxID=663243 RepID=UPI001BD2AF2D|nr:MULTISPECIES: DUF805 domain-containing protein [unclassified Variovorax]